MNDSFLFAEEKPADKVVKQLPPYRILIVDDDEEIHVITKMALNDFQLNQRGLQFVSAYSGEEAQQLLSEQHDFALVLLDVVMETDHAGLDVARWIRETLNNRLIRIVLRTGQPGQAPEEDIIARYEIDDYKEKTELTYRKLVTLMYSSLRAYRELCRIERNRSALEHIIKASAQLFSASSVRELSRGILEQLVVLMTHADTAAYCAVDGITASGAEPGNLQVLAGVGQYQAEEGQRLQQQVDHQVIKRLIAENKSVSFVLHQEDYYGLYHTRGGRYYLLFIQGIVKNSDDPGLADSDQNLLALFMNNTAIAFEHAEQYQ
ncbi:MAG: DUF3369 domain-containing protein [Idiomarina sp.]|nr:DUF3369 domain-containing protein [Idiomarina sp.]